MAVPALRPLIAARPGLVALLLAAVLLVRLLVPAGFMPTGGGALALMQCPAVGPVVGQAMHHGGHHPADKAPPEQPCAYSSAGLAAVDPVAPALRLAALLFAAVLALVAIISLPPARDLRWRPPLRAPPATA